MRPFRLLSALLLAALWTAAARAQTPPPPLTVLSPRPGEAVQGVVDIQIEVPRGSPMAFGGLYFDYAQDAGGTRFPIWEAESPRGGAPLTRWDTTSLTDGEYTLYLLIRLDNGSVLEATIPNLRVRNYTPIETPTPAPSATPAPGEASATPTSSPTPPPPTATPLPPNPAALPPAEWLQAAQRGALTALGLFALLALYAGIRSLRR